MKYTVLSAFALTLNNAHHVAPFGSTVDVKIGDEGVSSVTITEPDGVSYLFDITTQQAMDIISICGPMGANKP